MIIQYHHIDQSSRILQFDLHLENPGFSSFTLCLSSVEKMKNALRGCFGAFSFILIPLLGQSFSIGNKVSPSFDQYFGDLGNGIFKILSLDFEPLFLYFTLLKC